MKALIIGDVHLSDNPPSLRTDTYTTDILNKLEFCVEEAVRQNCDAIVQAGDLFHLKAPSRNSHELVQRTAEVLRSSNIPVLIVPGNHDMSNDRLDSLKRQPLGTLAKMSGIELLIGWHSDFPVFGLPYLADWNDLPKWMYRFGCEQQVDQPLMVAHAPIFPAGDEPPYHFISADDWAKEMRGGGSCYYGHIHSPHGIYLAQDTLMCNHGAISRGSLHEETLNRELAVTVWENDEFFRVPIPYRPAEEVFRLADKEALADRSSRVTDFISSVGQTRLTALSLEEVYAKAREQNFDSRTVSLLEELLLQETT